jgi:hypothetical protein
VVLKTGSTSGFQSAMVGLMAALPMRLDSGLAEVDSLQGTMQSPAGARSALWHPDEGRLFGGKRLLLASAESTGVPSVASAYYRMCERMGESGDCLGILSERNAVLLDRLFFALHFALLPTLQVALQTVANVALEQLETAVLTAIATYLLLWVAPEPITKLVAVVASAAMVAYIGCDTFFALRDGVKALRADLEEATHEDEVRAAGERFGRRMGPSVAKILVMVASYALGGAVAKLPPPSLPGLQMAAANAGAQGLTLSVAALEGASISLGARSLFVAMASTSVGGLVAGAGMKDGDEEPSIAKETRSLRSRLREAGLPGGSEATQKGPFRFRPRRRYRPGNPLPQIDGGYIDRFDNVWKKGPYHGDPAKDFAFEWDVQLSPAGQKYYKQFGIGKKGYINVAPDGTLSH